MTASTLAFVDTLCRVPLFNELSHAELASIAVGVSSLRFEAGAVIFSEGEKGGDLFIVQSGSVRIVKLSPGGRHQLIAIERPGNSLEESSVFDGGRYSVTALAIEDCTLLRLDGPSFFRFCLQHPDVAIKVIRVLAQRLKTLKRLVEDLSFATVRDRLIAHLLRLAQDAGKLCAEGILIELQENQEELAARLGTVRELISRNLGRLHGAGFIVMKRRALTIPDLDKLAAELSF
ncbi:Crp/Fnr family transcriptional regulator [Bryobacter aggregatus]|uniref:Crp/Fnr family transcriptional regulator n=1 Tax=Bryobacter aggregatus TaxID=360054 RepID=UPI0004E0B881|nr:Crp/Fnr family transcriptional regulator [Bryobacter aggregatus]